MDTAGGHDDRGPTGRGTGAMGRRGRAILIAGLIAAAFPAIGDGRAHDTPQLGPSGTGGRFDEAAALRTSQAAVGRRIGDHVFRDTLGKPVNLTDFKGRPVVVNLVYTACSHYCPLTVQNLARGVEAAQEALGKDAFTVLTIGFDSRNDHPARMRAYARAQGIDVPGWQFLSADPDTVHAFTEELGFLFFPAAQGFDHLAQTTILDADGTVFRQIYGVDPGVRAIVEPLKSLRFGQVSNLTALGDIVERVRLFCTLYDPATDAYLFDWSFFTGIAIGLICIAAILGFLILEVVRRGRAGHRA